MLDQIVAHNLLDLAALGAGKLTGARGLRRGNGQHRSKGRCYVAQIEFHGL
jgi:hypothetical protein